MNQSLQSLQGSELYDLLNDLKINLGNFNANAISAWYDTDCGETVKFLDWFRTFIGKDNVLGADVNEAYESLSEQGFVPTSDDCDRIIAETELGNPGIFNYEENVIDVDCLLDELEIENEYLESLEEAIRANEQLNKRLKDSYNVKASEEIVARITRDSAKEHCTKLAKDLEKTNAKLAKQMNVYRDMLVNFDVDINPSFISNINIDRHVKHCTDVNENVTRLLSNEDLTVLITNFGQNEDILNSSRIKTDATFTNDAQENLEDMHLRIAKSVSKAAKGKANVQQLQGIWNFIQNIDGKSIVAHLNEDELCMLEASVISKEEQKMMAVEDLEVQARATTSKYVIAPKLANVRSEIENTLARKECFNEKVKQFDTILAHQCLLLLMYDVENTNIKKTDKFFSDIYNYISGELKNVETRSNEMSLKIDEFNVYKCKPIEERTKIIKDIVTFVSDGVNIEIDFATVRELLTSVAYERIKIEKNLFVDSLNKFKHECTQRLKDINDLKSWLGSGTTHELVAMPYNLYNILNEVNDSLKTQDTTLKACMELSSETEKKLLRDKFLKAHRQLWMYFLVAPKKLTTLLDEIENEVKRKCNE